jgi:hypothetical protein
VLAHDVDFKVPQGLEPALSFGGLNGTAEEAAEKVVWVTSAAEAADGNRGLIVALKRCATQNQTFSAASEAVRF